MYRHQGNNELVTARTPFPQDRHLFSREGIADDSGLVLSTDAKPRLKWTPELHERFIEAVHQLGGADKATPKTVMRIMGIPGLTLYHLKSHLQKYRLSKNLQAHTNIGTVKNAIGCTVVADRISGGNGSITNNTNTGSPTNKTLEISEALMMQIEVQRQLNEQLEVQRHLQLRIETQGKYLQSVLEKAQETLGKQNMGAPGLDSAKVQLSELVSEVSNECLTTTFQDFKRIPSVHCLQASEVQITEHVTDNCMHPFVETKDNIDLDNVNIGLRANSGNLSHQPNIDDNDTSLTQTRLAGCRDLNEWKMFPSTPISPVRDLPMNIRAQRTRDDMKNIVETRQIERYSDHPHLVESGINKSAVKQQTPNSTCQFDLPCLAVHLDLNAEDDNDAAPNCRQFDLNGFCWN